MGTSKSFDGPTGSSPLLPPWAPELDPEPEEPGADGGAGDGEDDGGEDQEQDPEHGDDQDQQEQDTPPDFANPPAWQGVLGQATRFAKSGATGHSARTRARSIVGKYVRNRGGARRAATGSIAGRRTAQNLGAFLSDIASSGVEGALRNADLEQYIGGSADDFLAGFAESFLPPPNNLDDAAARRAAFEALYDLLEQYDALDGGIEALNQLNTDGIENAIEHFIGRYVCASVLSVLSQRLENGSISTDRCAAVEQEIRAVVIEAVRLDFRGRDLVRFDWNSDQARRMIDRLMLDAYTLLEE